LTRGFARRDGDQLFDMVQGFVRSQVLFALVQLRIPHRVMDGPLTVQQLSQGTGIPADRMAQLLQAGAAMGLLHRNRDGRFGAARLGAAMLGVPGLEQMIRHHDILYRDLKDPVALLRGDVQTELADFWPYVFGARGAVDPAVTGTYSDLMAQSQGLVAQDTLAAITLKGTRHLLDVGGGFGAFAQAVAQTYPKMRVSLFDLPHVVAGAEVKLRESNVSTKVDTHSGSFRDDPLPTGADAISLIRVLYDHSDDTVRGLLAKVLATLPPSGRLIISEPMSGGARPSPAGDVYFAFYTMAMRTGTVRSAERIADLCAAVGFVETQIRRSARPYVTQVVTAQKLSE
jgi:demethylspheroidene O-methyltransferase